MVRSDHTGPQTNRQRCAMTRTRLLCLSLAVYAGMVAGCTGVGTLTGPIPADDPASLGGQPTPLGPTAYPKYSVVPASALDSLRVR
jgi:hypothetical protein